MTQGNAITTTKTMWRVKPSEETKQLHTGGSRSTEGQKTESQRMSAAGLSPSNVSGYTHSHQHGCLNTA